MGINNNNNSSDGMSVHLDNVIDTNHGDSVDAANELDYMLDVDALIEDELVNDDSNNINNNE